MHTKKKRKEEKKKTEEFESSGTLGMGIQKVGNFLIFAAHPFAKHNYLEGTRYLGSPASPSHTAKTGC